jgi:hypothetical protein
MYIYTVGYTYDKQNLSHLMNFVFQCREPSLKGKTQ